MPTNESSDPDIETDIQEIIYIDEVEIKSSKHQSPNSFRRFLVRRQRSLEILFTNGIYHWVNIVPGAESNAPFEITDIILS